MTLLNSEIVICRLDTGNGALVLTSHRVLHGWQSKFTSILLKDVASVFIARLTHRWILFVAGTCVAMAACLAAILGATALGYSVLEPVDTYRRVASTLLFASAFLIVAFAVKRFNMVQISSSGGTIGFRFPSALRRDIKRFLIDLDRARIVWYFGRAR